ncbi:hypothetical protein D9C73_028387 [Collichthys lucidus]|uniref:Uncharacterized protein n=1 Tax=Collichthys lucidus TaxID=240159 RepID=A0A4U5TY25_COLLU|nr:hypothetical protein D9C73_028387 [Collichthys lucidus]
MYFYKSHGSETRHGDRGRRPDDTAEISTLYVKALLSYRRKCPKQEAVSQLDPKVSQLDPKVSQLDPKVSQVDPKVSQVTPKYPKLLASPAEPAYPLSCPGTPAEVSWSWYTRGGFMVLGHPRRFRGPVQVQEEEEEEIKPKSTHTAGVPAPRQSVSQDHDSERLPEHRGSNVEIHQQSAPKGAPGLRQPFAVVVMGHRLSWSWDTGCYKYEEEEEEIKPKSTHTAGVPAPRQSVSQDHDSERLPEHRGSLGVRMLRGLKFEYAYRDVDHDRHAKFQTRARLGRIHQQSAPKGAPGLRQPFAVVVMGHRLSWSWDTGLQVQEEEEEEIKPKSTHTAGVPAPRQSVSQDHDSERLPEHRGSLGVRMLRGLKFEYAYRDVDHDRHAKFQTRARLGRIHQQSAPKGAPGLRQPFAVVVMGHRLSWSWDTGLQVQEEEEEEIKPKSTHKPVSQHHDSRSPRTTTANGCLSTGARMLRYLPPK